MSERTLSGLLMVHHANHDKQAWTEQGGTIGDQIRCECPLCHMGNDALAADPDVVAVARKIVDETCKGTLSPEQAWAVGLIKRWMEETFKFRLTDDGWEYTDA